MRYTPVKDYFADPPKPDPWMTIEDAQEYLQVGRSWIETRIRDGSIKYARMRRGGRIRFRREWLDDALATHTPRKRGCR